MKKASRQEASRHRVRGWWAAVVAGLVAMGGCGVATSPLVVQVRVREGEKAEALAGAWVMADVPALGPSMKMGDIVDEMLGKRAAVETREQTDASGMATVRYVPERAVRIGVMGVGLPPEFVLVDGTMMEPRAGWVDVPGGRGVQVRAGPVGAFSAQWSMP